MKSKKIFFLTGELSGESHAAQVVAELIKKYPEAKIKALGSSLLRELGVEIAVDYQDYSFSGFTEVVLNLGKILKLKKMVLAAIKDFEADAVVLVDYGGFNLEIAKELKAGIKKGKFKDLKIIEYIAPQIWASRPGRIKKIKANVDKVLCTLPFEEEIYKGAGVPVRFVGNPVANSLSPKTSKSELFEFLGKVSHNGQPASGNNETVIGLFPGSRKSEIKYMLPLMIKSAQIIKDKFPQHNFKFLLARASSISQKVLEKHGLDKEQDLIEVIEPSQNIADKNKKLTGNNHKLLSAADMLWLCSGTVTLEAALYGTPYFLSYKADPLTYQLYKIFKIIDMAGLANIIADRYIVPEFIQDKATIENFVNQSSEWLSQAGFSEAYYKIQEELLETKTLLGKEKTSEIVAEEIIGIIS